MSNKMRNSGGDPVMGLAQFVGRKLRNHDPLKEIDTRKAKGRTINYRNVSIVDADTDAPVVLYELADGRAFTLSLNAAGALEAA